MIWQRGITLLLQSDPLDQIDHTDLILSALEMVNTLRTQLNTPACLTVIYPEPENEYWRQMMIEHYAAGLRFIGMTTIKEVAAQLEYRYVVLLEPDQQPFLPNMPVFMEALAQSGADAAYGMVISEDSNVYNNEPINRGVLTRLISFAMYDAVYIANEVARDDISLVDMAFDGAEIVFVPSVFGKTETPFTPNKIDYELLQSFDIQPEDIRRYHPKLGAY